MENFCFYFYYYSNLLQPNRNDILKSSKYSMHRVHTKKDRQLFSLFPPQEWIIPWNSEVYLSWEKLQNECKINKRFIAAIFFFYFSCSVTTMNIIWFGIVNTYFFRYEITILNKFRLVWIHWFFLYN